MRKTITILIAIFITISTLGQADTLKQIKELAVNLKVLNKTQINITVKNISKKNIKAYSYVKSDD